MDAEKSEKKPDEHRDIDGGWAWVVLQYVVFLSRCEYDKASVRRNLENFLPF